MEEMNKNYVNRSEEETEGKTLSVFCSDSVGVKAKMTFDSCVVEGVQITYWQDDDEDMEERIESVFAMLFEEVIKTRSLSRNKVGN
ncbi:MAG: hypothetical protein UR25_C0004G0008 [Candidatus Nomurabacteria bacterium GW2011_GWE1_32_28]|uniref:Uncharacterized protein n=1 Tax=Candidatus Nomurabacteria bacterium GW2011_GWF1_31_48 TaxID=1618767 RepID=A0A0F9YEL5_9BACT|nr:MAG: hypothetical protein UR10_C0004G0007 [Candidatus Nomurabacteria bacterium GW2011_GWF2_30_133]KKP28504.1 MAG: hypothetical protein UR18_C0003G0007 [Candidatus Nomurabacteria bacterium GW2011_GWE2_31_40]KKP30099.1 MAG: hypothetical protein UR19_C0004G0007 [Candidatus Nomurabacteria bacterium GW2011_GWF1_31_48]KKP34644.1 MAG: hypothetical protein UR25_C0004G0008 [Candidatus Nomurabacteria bacterium GW2011_GWE1_32_28]HAS80894.1 hypothetical protein [Candidatus Nomurabacteria bacterium]